MLRTETELEYFFMSCPGVAGHQRSSASHLHRMAMKLLAFEPFVLLSRLIQLLVDIDEAGSQAMKLFVFFTLDLINFLQLFPIKEVQFDFQLSNLSLQLFALLAFVDENMLKIIFV